MKIMLHRVHLKILQEGPRTALLLLFLLAGFLACGQAVVMRGKVMDESGTPIPGATVTVKGTSSAAVTDDNGGFAIRNISKEAILVISSIGYERQEIKASGEKLQFIVLKQHLSRLDEALVIAYGTTTKRLNTGSISVINTENIEKQPIANPLEAMEGRATGLVITQQTGVPGGGFSVQIRGQNSLRSDGNDPLYIVDGVPFTSTSLSNPSLGSSIVPTSSPLNSLNPADIESIEILKDADATAIYGSRGANGVILITTKKGKPGKTKAEINLYTGMGKVSNMLSLLNTSQYLKMRHEAFSNDNIALRPWDYDLNGTWDTTRYTNWEKLLIGGTSHITNASGTVSGGNSTTQFLVGANYFRESTVFPGDFSDRKGSAHFNLSHTSVDQKFKLDLSVSYVDDNNNLPRQDLTQQALTLPPNAPDVYGSDGQLNWVTGFNNPFSQLLVTYKANSDNLIANMVLSYKLLNGLYIKSSMGYNYMQMREVSTIPIASYDPAFNQLGASLFGNNNMKSWIAEPQIDYNKKIGNGKLNILLGTSFQQRLDQSDGYMGTGFTSDALLENIKSAPSIRVVNSNYSQYRYSAIFGRINYNYKDRYLINLTGRRDGSSRFGPGRQLANFGAVGAGWIFTSEPFMKKLSFLNYGKLRVSYGTTGSDQIGDYGFLDTYSSTSHPYQNINGLIPTRLANPDYSWEINKKFEAALEMGLANNRISFTINYFRNRSSNQLVGYPLPFITGFSTIQYNLPATVQNTGWEMDIYTANIKSRNFSWNTEVTISIPSSRLIAFPNIKGSSYANTYVVGQSLSLKKQYHYLGVDPQTGVYTFEDVDNSGGISSPADLLAIKTSGKHYYGGIQNDIQYKGFRLNFFIQIVNQTGRNYLYSPTFQVPGFLGNQYSIVMDRWQKPDDRAPVQKFTASAGTPAYFAWTYAHSSGDNTISNASFIRLKNIFLSYNIPEQWIQKLQLKKASIYLGGENIFTLTKYLGLDPETQNTSVLPLVRLYTVGIQITL